MDMKLKKSKEDEESVEKFAMANCVDIMRRNESLGRPKLFKCKKCKKRFESFQALGGHMTSHKNRLNKLTTMSTNGELLPVNLKKHECSICGKDFAIGQALGGHMRKHRDELNQLEHKKKQKLDENLIKSTGELSEALYDKTKLDETSQTDELVKALHEKTSLDSTRRTLTLDLNLTTDENELSTG
ncbi:zinc finger protein ZAT8-like [Solanum tuberosum]|nr:PREDICTED: zinc finger protein ZAT8-like [Solanum tuberosum]